MPSYRRRPDLLVEPLNMDGLTAKQAEERKRAGLANTVKRNIFYVYLRIVLRNLFSWFNIILFAVAIGFMILGIGTSKDTQYTFTKYGFMVPVVLNLLIGTFQECRASHLINRLSLINEQKVKVFRDNQWISIRSSEIVLGDLIRIKQGDQVPVDGVIKDRFLDLDESILTGEQKERRRIAGDSILAGAIVISGEAIVRVRGVGRDTYAQKLQQNVARMKKPKPEMVKAIDRFVWALSIMIVPLAFLSGYISYRTLQPYSDAGLFQDVAVTVGTTIVGAIPTGLVLLASARCALSVIALYKEKTSVKELKAVEGLAMSDIVCLDKTGTLTTGEMEFAGATYLERDQREVDSLLAAVLQAVPDSSETALALKRRFSNPDTGLRPTNIVPFNSKIKQSGCSFEGLAGFFALGAPQFLLDPNDPLLRTIKAQAEQGLRVLVFIRRNSDSSTTPLCLLYLKDTIRPHAAAIIKRMIDSHITIKIISGDDPVTVAAIAKRLGIPAADSYINMKGLSRDQTRSAAHIKTIFGRTTPEQKQEIIKALQAQGHKVTMVIDALNDLLAAKASDCSICISHEGGSSAAAQVADVTILDGDFAHMPAIFKEGRKTVNDMQRSSTLFLMKSFLALGLAACSPLFGHIPYSVEGLYLVTWFVTGVGGFILGLEDTNEPVSPGFAKRVLAKSIPAGFFLFMCVFSVQLMVKTGAMHYAIVQPHLGMTMDNLPSALKGFKEGAALTYSEYLKLLGSVTPRDDLLKSILFIEEPTCIIAAVIGAYAVMIQVCQPLNKFRITTMGICLTIILAAALVLPMFFLGSDNIPRGLIFAFVPFYSKDCFYYALSTQPSSWIFLLVLGLSAIPLYALILYLSENLIFKTKSQKFSILKFTPYKKDNSLVDSVKNIFGRKGEH